MWRLILTGSFIALGLVSVVRAAVLFAKQLILPPGLTAGELAAISQLDNPIEPLSKFYDWRQDLVRKVAGGAGAGFVTLIAAAVAAGLAGGTTTKEIAEQTTGPPLVKTTTQSATTPTELLMVATAFAVVAIGFFLFAPFVQRRMIKDIEALP